VRWWRSPQVLWLAFLSTPRSEGGGEGLALTLVEDRAGHIAKAYGVMREGSGYSFRAMFLIDSEGVVVARQVGDLPSGLGAREAKRLVMMCHAGKAVVESLSLGMDGLELHEVGMGPKNGEPTNDKRSSMEDVMEDVKSNNSMDKETKGFGGSADNTGALPAKKSSLVKGEKEEVAKEKDKKRAPSICSCEFEFHHSRNLHQYTSMQRQK